MEDRTELVVILDRSGSMEEGRADHEGGLRSFIRDQRSLAGEVRLTFVRFDSADPCELVYDGTPLTAVDETHLCLVPRGTTPLLDAVGRTLTHVEARLRDRPADLIVALIITDGLENASREWTKAQVKTLIERLEGQGWKVLYLGAHMEGFQEAGSMGVSAASSLKYAATPTGTAAMYANVGENLTAARVAWRSGADVLDAYQRLHFTEDQRTRSEGEEA